MKFKHLILGAASGALLFGSSAFAQVAVLDWENSGFFSYSYIDENPTVEPSELFPDPVGSSASASHQENVPGVGVGGSTGATMTVEWSEADPNLEDRPFWSGFGFGVAMFVDAGTITEANVSGLIGELTFKFDESSFNKPNGIDDVDPNQGFNFSVRFRNDDTDIARYRLGFNNEYPIEWTTYSLAIADASFHSGDGWLNDPSLLHTATIIDILVEYNMSSVLRDSFGPGTINLTVDSASIIPEPSTYALIFGGLALAGAWFYRRRR
ncbi:MAG: PEP-CTERM sorting domain-containing protein [Puniceicoccaceae bacterium]|nr:MAG: PEP-CTERM sorting domain-containing protein [Puniceicoccaceae bacterium]